MAVFQPFSCYLHKYLSQNRGSDGHFEVLTGSVPQLVQKLWHKTQMGRLLIERIHSSSLKALWLKWNKLGSKVPLCHAVVHLLWRVSSLDGGLQFHALKLFYLIDENGIISSNSIHCGLVILTLLLKISSASFTFSLAYRVFKFRKVS